VCTISVLPVRSLKADVRDAGVEAVRRRRGCRQQRGGDPLFSSGARSFDRLARFDAFGGLLRFLRILLRRSLVA
jgi:hypothetical protein